MKQVSDDAMGKRRKVLSLTLFVFGSADPDFAFAIVCMWLSMVEMVREEEG